MNTILSQDALDQLFCEARTHFAWTDRPLTKDVLMEIYELAKMGPTSANCSPLRILFIESKDAKEKLRPCLAAGNVDKTMSAPVTAIFAQDLGFYAHLPRLFPHTDAKSWFEDNHPLVVETAALNATLQAAYFMLAARACGVDCGPMSGFDAQETDLLFFSGTTCKSLFLCNLGYGDSSVLHPRSPRLAYSEVCRSL